LALIVPHGGSQLRVVVWQALGVAVIHGLLDCSFGASC
jgi:hypothetical protein